MSGSLQPPLDPWYIGQRQDKEFKLQEYMNDVYAQAITINQSFWSEADIDYRFYAGDQTIWNDIYGNLPAYRRRQFNFNRIRRIINMITGYQRQHRKSLIATPIENSSQEAADQYSEVFLWLNQTANLYEIISEAFLGSSITGMNFVGIDLDWTQDPINGDFKFRNVAYNAYLADPYFRQHDLSDCDYFWERKYLSHEEAMLMFPWQRDRIRNMEARGSASRDGRFYFLPESYNYGSYNLLALDMFYYRDTRLQKVLVDLQTGETRQWEGPEDELRLFLQTYPQVEVKETYVPTVNAAFVLEDDVVYHGPNPLGIDNYPYAGVYCYYTPQIAYYPFRVQGVVRSIRDSQFLYNRRKIIELDILESQVNSGWKYKEDALVNPADIFLQGQGKGVAIKQEAQMSDVEKIQPGNVPPSMIELSRALGEEITQISGVNEELLGSATDDKSGILSMLRQGAGLITLQQLYDQLDQSQKRIGQLIVETIQKNWTPGKVQKIVKEKPAPEFFTKNWAKYNIVVEEGLNTSTQRQMQFIQLLHLKELGIPVPTKVLIESSTLQDKPKLVKALQEQEQQQAQAEAQATQMQQGILQAQMQDLQARAAANQGLGIERASRVQENQSLAVERRAEAIKDLQLGSLHQVKAAKELETLDLQNLEKLIAILKAMQAESAEEAGVGAQPSPQEEISEEAIIR